eukprot:TRINITY_DN4914_c0_g1_i1.p2 TRINITY_DN4914_c0_g1~~TRINITY_DN4914_c0_g1_i1.p2  ORF type:complete len:161 (-),score=26.30 TRINITY_DN4914_c0_g1_i1:150-632(-)
MLSVAMQKNPARKTRYWEEVCMREDTAHIFHAAQFMRASQRTTPQSTYGSTYDGGASLVHQLNIVTHAPYMDSRCGGGAGSSRGGLASSGGCFGGSGSLGAAGRSSLTPRGSAGSATSRRRGSHSGDQSGLVQHAPQGDCTRRSARPLLADGSLLPPAGI